MQQAIKPNCDIVTYNELIINPENFLIFLKDGDKIIGFIFKNDMDNFSVQETSCSKDTSDDFDSIQEMVDYYSKKLGHEVTVWYEKVEDCA